MPAKKRRRNIQQGYFDATGFHPIRASRDYDSGRLFDDSEGSYKRKKKAKGKKRKSKNPTTGLPIGKLVRVIARKRSDGRIELYAAR